jgi:2-oxoacid:acceptor oxidoreductase delta subunit (pyruvate/2-ketoisovalerate family)
MKTQKLIRILGPCATTFGSANTGCWRIERPKFDPANCIKCGICERSCPLNVVTVYKDKDEAVEIDWRYCKGCGICAYECPKKCLVMVDERGVE